MANANVNLIATSNTFNDWRIRDNNLANSVNELRNGNFWKDGGNFILGTGALIIVPTFGTGLQLGGDALLSGTTTMNTQITTGQASIFGNVLMRSALNVAGPFLFDANDSTFKLDVNGDATVNNLTVRGNTSTLGTQSLVADTFVLRSGLATSGSGWLNVHRGAANTEASLKWVETSNVWQYINVSSNIYYTILTTQNIDDTVANTSTSNVGSANAVKTAYDHGTAAFNQANTAYGQANSAYAQANLAYTRANVANTQGNAAFDQANSAYAQANLAYAAANSAAGGGLQTTGGTMTGNITFSGIASLVRPRIGGASELVNTNTAVTQSTFTANLANTNIFDITVENANVAITFTNAPITGNAVTATVILRQPSTIANGFTIANTVKWSNGEIPVLSSGIANKLDVLTFLSVDGGTTFYGAHSLANVG